MFRSDPVLIACHCTPRLRYNKYIEINFMRLEGPMVKSIKLELGDGLPESESLGGGELELKSSWLARTINASKRTRTPRRTYHARQTPNIAG